MFQRSATDRETMGAGHPVAVAGREARMASKDKGGRSPKKAPAKDLKQKRLDKKAKHSGTAAGSTGKLT